MKIRNCFVSNSSTSSFCILGTTVDADILKKLKKIAKKYCKNKGYKFVDSDSFKELAEQSGLDYEIDDRSEYGDIIGMSVANLSPAQIVETEKELIEMFGDIGFSVMVGANNDY